MAVLDLCSSWISHYPKGYTAGRIAGEACAHAAHLHMVQCLCCRVPD